MKRKILNPLGYECDKMYYTCMFIDIRYILKMNVNLILANQKTTMLKKMLFTCKNQPEYMIK